jgi:hypothetical protein
LIICIIYSALLHYYFFFNFTATFLLYISRYTARGAGHKSLGHIQRVGRRGGTGISPRFPSENWREEITLGKYAKTKFIPVKKKGDLPSQMEVIDIAHLMVKDMTEKLTLGLIVPLDAKLGYKGETIYMLF